MGILRMWFFGLLAVIFLTAVAHVAPQQLAVGVWKLGLVTLSGYLGYWLDRALFPYARPHVHITRQNVHFGLTTLRRAIIVAATMLATAIAL